LDPVHLFWYQISVNYSFPLKYVRSGRKFEQIWVNLWAVSEISLIRTKREKKKENQNTSNLARTDAKYAVRFPSDDEF